MAKGLRATSTHTPNSVAHAVGSVVTRSNAAQEFAHKHHGASVDHQEQEQQWVDVQQWRRYSGTRGKGCHVRGQTTGQQ